ncbi:MAG: hypothetical protein K0Q55_1490 [Verrucomicrobia bacterium]|jgi:hypothetical protein|nr:hypothetical protein [Verrucomicrobiota bacterium]
MENEPAKSAPRRPALHGLDAKALLAAGLEVSPSPNKPSPQPLGSTNLSRRKWLILGGLTAIAIGTAWFYSRKKPAPWQELLPSIDLNSTHSRGEWRHTDGGVESLRDDQPNLLAIPAELGDSYDLRLAFTRLTGNRSITLFFRTAQGTTTLEFDSWEQAGLAGIQLIDSQDLRQSGSFTFPIVNGQPYEFMIEVRPNELRVLHQQKVLKSYPVKGRELQVPTPWGWEDAWASVPLAIGAWNSKVRFSQLSYRKVR